jgi:hypothetical protein
LSRHLELFRSEDIVIRYYPRDTERCVVTFEAISFDLNLDREAFGEEFMMSRGISAIHILSRHNNWYQDEGLPEILSCVAQAASRYPHVVAYGSSMGGYAALRYADEVAADLVIAISPQYSLSQKRAPFETRWRQQSRSVRWGTVDKRPLSPRARAIVIFDPYLRQDRAHVELIARDRPIERITVPFSGHPASTFLVETAVFASVIEHLLAGEPVDHLVTAALRQRRSTPVYWHTLSEYAFRRNRRRAIALARKGIEFHPEVHYLWNQLGHALLMSGRYAEAAIALEQSLRLDTTPRVTTWTYARALAASGELKQAGKVAAGIGVSRLAVMSATLLLWAEHLSLRLIGRG